MRLIPTSLANPRDLSFVSQRLLRIQEAQNRAMQAEPVPGKSEGTRGKRKGRGGGRAKPPPQTGGGGKKGGRSPYEEEEPDGGPEEEEMLVAFHPINDFKIYDLDFAEMFSRR